MAAFAWLLWRAIAESRAGSTVLEVSANPMRPGERCRAFVSQSTRSAIDALRVLLVCEEQVTFRTASPPRYAIEAGPRAARCFATTGCPRSPGAVREDLQFEVPADAMHSLEVPNNKITWKLEVEGGRPYCQSFRRQYAVVVHPPRPSGAA